MAIFRSLLLFAFILRCSSSLPFLSGTTAADESTDLALGICRNTTDYAFCRDVMHSDPRLPGADRNFIAALVFRLTYRNATNTKDYIASELIKAGRTDLRRCNDCYERAIQRLVEILGDLDSETYYGLDKLTVDVEDSIRACAASVGGRWPPLSKRNDDMLKLSSICLVISKLFIYH